jgi:Cu/Ag efflux pump CusA
VNQSYFIRAEGKVKSLDDIENIVVKNRNGTPIYVKMWLMSALVMRTVLVPSLVTEKARRYLVK